MKNYNYYSKPNHVATNAAKTESNEVSDEPVSEAIQESVSEPEVPKKNVGVVVKCVSLNVREDPSTDSAVLAELTAGSEVLVNDLNSDSEFYSICTASGIDGYCMAKFVAINP